MIEGIVSSLIATSIATGFKYREQLWKRILWNGFYKNKTIRISVGSLIKIENDDKVLLIRNINRPELFSPIGGVIKHHSSAKSFLNSIDWEKEKPLSSNHKDKIDRDLRGYIPAKNLFNFLNWYLSVKDREENSLHREIKEELKEVGLKKILDDLDTPQFSLIRTISEGPYEIPGKSYYQFRLLSIYEFSEDYSNDSIFFSNLLNEVDGNKDLIMASSEEIYQGRTITTESRGSNSEYLFRNIRKRIEDSPWSHRK